MIGQALPDKNKSLTEAEHNRSASFVLILCHAEA